MLRLGLVVAILLCSACPGEVPPRDGMGRIDAGAGGTVDAPVGGAVDAPVGGSVDAPMGMADARPMADAMSGGVDAAVPCTYQNRSGTCIDQGICAAQGNQVVSSSMGAVGCGALPAEIKCCLPPVQGSPQPQPNAGLTEESGVEGCPDGMLRIHTSTTSYCIDRFECTLDKVNTDGTTEPWSPYYNPGNTTVMARSIRGAVPQGYITGEQAKAACLEAGKRLCTDTEWQRACGGPDNTVYPYGPTREPGVCNDARAQHPAVELFGSVTNLTSPLINQLQPGLDRTGGHSGCVTAEGAFDMMGNLHEWTADPNGTFRGGFYVDTVINGPGCQYVTTAHNTLHYDYSTGFRCCAD